MKITENAALILVDLQKAIDHPSWGVRNNPAAEETGAALLRQWRSSKRPVIHIRHDSVEPQSTYRPGQPLHDFKPEFIPLPDEALIGKHTGSAFVGTGLHELLQSRGLKTLVVFGVITNNSVEATVRHAGCLEYQVLLVEDACFTFAKPDWRGNQRSADDVHAMSLANLHGEYCTVVRSSEVLEGLR